MTKAQLLETIQKALPIKLHTAYIEQHIDHAFTDALPAIYNLFPAVIDQYSTTFTCDVKKEGAKYYCDIPTKIVHFPLAGGGVRSVDPTTDYDIMFVPSTFAEMKVHGNLEVGDISDEIPYFTTIDKVQFGRKPGGNTQVEMRIIVPISAKDDDDEIYLPVGAIKEIAAYVTSYAQQTPPEKESNDQSGKQI